MRRNEMTTAGPHGEGGGGGGGRRPVLTEAIVNFARNFHRLKIFPRGNWTDTPGTFLGGG